MQELFHPIFASACLVSWFFRPEKHSAANAAVCGSFCGQDAEALGIDGCSALPIDIRRNENMPHNATVRRRDCMIGTPLAHFASASSACCGWMSSNGGAAPTKGAQ